MARAGFCSGCGANVWLTPQGGCVNGHGPEYISGAYEVAQAPAQTVAPVVAPPATYAQPSAPGYPAPLPAEPPRRRTGMIVLIVVAVSIVFLCGCGVLGLTLFGAQEFQSQSDDAVARSCAANLRTLDGAVQVWLAEHEGGDIGAIDSMDTAREALQPYVADFDRAVTCPGEGQISVADGVFTCSVPEHNF